MADDKYSKENIKGACDKAEFLDRINKYLPDCTRAFVILEVPDESIKGSMFHSAQVGFKQYYEVMGFLEYAKELYYDDDEEDVRRLDIVSSPN